MPSWEPQDLDSVGRGGRRAEGGRWGERITPKSARELLQPERVPEPPPRSHAVRHPLVVFLNLALTVVIVALVAGIGTVIVGKVQYERAGPLDQPRTIVIGRGDTLNEVAALLRRQGAISSYWIFRIGARISGEQDNIKAGEYLIPAHASMREILESFVSGRAILYSVTIPEGYTSKQIVARLEADETLTGEIADVPPEGSLLPETYKFSRGDTRQGILNRMRQERNRVLNEIWSRRVEDLPLQSPEEMVTLASIVEKETGIADERTRVAAVFINRLRRSMRLQSDPTIIYGLFGGDSWMEPRTITRSQLDAPNEYNTYQIPGLPPGPIANPGRAALEAVANPSRTRDLFFAADGSGGHAFAETYEEHQRNVARLRQIEARRREAAARAGAEGASAPAPAAETGQAAPTP